MGVCDSFVDSIPVQSFLESPPWPRPSAWHDKQGASIKLGKKFNQKLVDGDRLCG